MTYEPKYQPDPENDRPEVSHADQAAFFARLEAKLEEEQLEPEPEWKARTIGHFVLNPQAYKLVMASCVAVLLLAAGIIGFAVQHANRPLDNLEVPPGYQLVSTADGRMIVVVDRQSESSKDQALRAAALRELQQLLAEPQQSYPADGLAVTASSSP